MKIERPKGTTEPNDVIMADAPDSESNRNHVSELVQHVESMSFDDEYEDGDDRREDTENDLPNILIITNVDDSVFENEEAKAHFERLFCEFDSNSTIQYLKSFRRARVEYTSPIAAAKTRIQLHKTQFGNKTLNCYFAQPKEVQPDNSSPHLQPPPLDKQFLISPPASPPVGWEQVNEQEPVINYELLKAITSLAPGESHELHPASDHQPGIVVHVCEDPEGYDAARPKIIQTRRPTRTS